MPLKLEENQGFLGLINGWSTQHTLFYFIACTLWVALMYVFSIEENLRLYSV
jgi:hypothetical protein